MSLARRFLPIRNAFTVLREYRRSVAAQAISPDQLRELQWRRLKKLLTHAWRRVPFYRRRFRDAGLTPADVRSPADLRHLPPLTKSEIQQYGTELVARGVESPLREASSSGSTGQPTTVYLDRRSMLRKNAVFLRNLVDAGYRVGQRLPQVWGGPWALACPDKACDGYRLSLGGGLPDQLAFFTTGAYRCIMLSVFEMTDQSMRQFTDWLRREKPSVVAGFTIALDAFARYLQRTGAADVRPRGLITTAEPLLPAVRSRLQEVFACPVYNRYATNEVFGIAQECGHPDCQPGRMHLNAEALFVEIARDGRPVPAGTSGRVLVTDLLNYAMPLVRYDLQDIASLVPERCPCGRPAPLLSPVEGRVDEFFLLPGDRLVNAAFFRSMFHSNKGIARYQVLQDEVRKIDVRIVRDLDRFDAEAFEESRRLILEHLGPEVQVAFEFVDRIDSEQTGKYRYTFSRVYRQRINNAPHETSFEEALV